ncbi:MAG: 1-(5-phosphoribosyl)-5-[(5-phosphoribosylamino)methylideneamino]imidazole-4-carboxamide isomerase [Dehalococcoidales bacterium]|nr:1-(5-phosphoribosyl)-5-[(5-phosphoribosylamino)methylideneamino]imidazole-4-carboxamide isomerase [Dehalococcoidales bacterium]
MEIIPAVDLRNGKCVRLYKGDYSRETVYDENPLNVALQWQSLGAPRVHIVDLDGAAAGEVINLEIIKTIAGAVQVPTELGGGIRSLETITSVLKMGIERVILGTVAVEDPGLVEKACRRYAESIIVSIDARNGWVSTRGWLQASELKALDLASEMKKLGVKRLIYTDIERDGTLSGPNYRALSDMVEGIDLPVIAAGGISSLEHLEQLRKIGVEGAIIGQALYTGNISLKQALQVAGR